MSSVRDNMVQAKSFAWALTLPRRFAQTTVARWIALLVSLSAAIGLTQAEIHAGLHYHNARRTLEFVKQIRIGDAAEPWLLKFDAMGAQPVSGGTIRGCHSLGSDGYGWLDRLTAPTFDGERFHTGLTALAAGLGIRSSFQGASVCSMAGKIYLVTYSIGYRLSDGSWRFATVESASDAAHRYAVERDDRPYSHGISIVDTFGGGFAIKVGLLPSATQIQHDRAFTLNLKCLVSYTDCYPCRALPLAWRDFNFGMDPGSGREREMTALEIAQYCQAEND